MSAPPPTTAVAAVMVLSPLRYLLFELFGTEMGRNPPLALPQNMSTSGTDPGVDLRSVGCLGLHVPRFRV